MKSGSYTVERPLQPGAAAVEASEAAVAALSAYGRELGEAFALRDDLLGVWGNPKVTGKPAGDDLLSRKGDCDLGALSQAACRSSARHGSGSAPPSSARPMSSCCRRSCEPVVSSTWWNR
jgi:geranylgeranyl diphosphate synthase, type I